MSELDTVKDLLEDKGWQVQIQSETQTGGTADNPTYTNSSVTVQAFIGGFSRHETDGTLVQANDQKAYIAGDTVITKKDNVIDDGTTYHIKDLRPVKASGAAFLYIAQLRA